MIDMSGVDQLVETSPLNGPGFIHLFQMGGHTGRIRPGVCVGGPCH